MLQRVLLLTLLVNGCSSGAIIPAGGAGGGGGGGRDAGGTGGGADAGGGATDAPPWYVPPSGADGGATSSGGEPVPLNPTADNSTGLKLDGTGRLVLDADGAPVVLKHIWVANSPEGTVSKINTDTGVEEGRYFAGPSQAASDPSRTTVGLTGDVVVAARTTSGAARIHADPATCPDKNGNGVIETSTGPSHVLPWGQDECVLWYHQFPEGSIARAAAFDFKAGVDGELSSSVWIGLHGTQKVVRLDAQTGNVLAEIDVPGHSPYGMAFDGNGNLWVQGGNLLRIDTSTLQWESIQPPGCMYGIAADRNGNVWVGGGNCVARYQATTRTWTQLDVGMDNYGGIAIDAHGSVWSSGRDYGAIRIDEATMTLRPGVPLAGGCKGMAVDFHDRIWCISQTSSLAYRIDPQTLASQGFATGQSPYTYSDMTGFQLKNAAPPSGIFRAQVPGCGSNQEWLQLLWTADTPAGTFVRFRARTGLSDAEIAGKPYVQIAQQPTAQSPADLKAALEAAAPGSSKAPLLELEITLSSQTPGVTPALSNVKLVGFCPVG
jgi:streptogramin lyase